MSSVTTISVEKLPPCRDTQVPGHHRRAYTRRFWRRPAAIPGAIPRCHSDVTSWACEFAGRSAVVVCQRGQKLSEG